MFVDPRGTLALLTSLLLLGLIGSVANVVSQALTDIAFGNNFDIENYGVAAVAGFIGGMCYAIPGVGSIVGAAVTSGLTTAGQMAVSKSDYSFDEYAIQIGISASLAALTSYGFGKISNKLSFFKDSNYILNNFTKFATNYGGITLKTAVILQVAGQIAIRESVANFVGAPLSKLPNYISEVMQLRKLGLNSKNSLIYAM